MSALASLDDISSSLAGLVPAVEIEVQGAWKSTHRRTYENERQAGSGLGPFVDVVDMRWRGQIDCDAPVTGIAFLDTGREIHWAKSGRPVEDGFVEVSLHARADYVDGRATLAPSLMGSVLPGVPVAFAGNVESSCILGTPRFATGQAHVVASMGDVVFVVILLQRNVIKMGRNNLWHLRAELAASVPDHLRPILTRGRTDVLRTHRQNLAGESAV